MDHPRVRWDREVNAAYISFREPDPGEASKKFPLEDEQGETHILLRLAASGELLGIELLMADEQMPRIFREDT